MQTRNTYKVEGELRFINTKLEPDEIFKNQNGDAKIVVKCVQPGRLFDIDGWLYELRDATADEIKEANNAIADQIDILRKNWG